MWTFRRNVRTLPLSACQHFSTSAFQQVSISAFCFEVGEGWRGPSFIRHPFGFGIGLSSSIFGRIGLTVRAFLEKDEPCRERAGQQVSISAIALAEVLKC
jgi:hypothetical protein